MRNIILLLIAAATMFACKENATPGGFYDDVDFVYSVPYDPDPEVEAALEKPLPTITATFANSSDEDVTIGFRVKAGGFFRDYPREVKFRVEPAASNPDAEASHYFTIDYSQPYVIEANELSVIVPVKCFNLPDQYIDLKGKELRWNVIVESNEFFEAKYHPNQLGIVIKVNEKYQ